MTPYFEEAAQLLLQLSRLGLQFDGRADIEGTLTMMAACILAFHREAPSHAAAAAAMLRGIEAKGFNVGDARCRARLIAVIGTELGNAELRRRRVGR